MAMEGIRRMPDLSKQIQMDSLKQNIDKVNEEIKSLEQTARVHETKIQNLRKQLEILGDGETSNTHVFLRGKIYRHEYELSKTKYMIRVRKLANIDRMQELSTILREIDDYSVISAEPNEPIEVKQRENETQD